MLEYKLNGKKVLIGGNHDRKSVNTRILDGYVNLHGHIHNKKLSEGYLKNCSEAKHINLSVDVTCFKSLSLNEINKMGENIY